MARKIAAFFDVDNTLLKGNTGVIYARYLRKKGKLPFSVMLEILWLAFLNKINHLNYDGLAKKLFHILAGHTEEEMQGIIRDCFENEVKPLIYENARKQIEEHKKQGHQIILVSASQSEIVELFAKELKADHFFASTLEKKGDVFTGNLSAILYHDKKAEVVKEYAKKQGIDLKQSFVYSDSFSDLPLLQLVGNPIATNPDSKLKRFAKKNGWKTIHFLSTNT